MRLSKEADRLYKQRWAEEHRDRCKEAMNKYLYNGNTCVVCGVKIQRNSTRCVKCLNKGERSHFWKGGISSLRDLIRTIAESHNWNKQVLRRDNYTCQECNVRGGHLHAHHKYPFAKILKDFLKEYSQFSPIEDKETLVRLAATYKPFWNIDNGTTLCPECHKLGVHQWKSKR